MRPPPKVRLRLLRAMKRIRAYEEGIAIRYAENRMRCPTHLSIGQEAVSAALGEILKPDDLAVSTHRGHAHYLAKGGHGPRMIAELYGKSSGCAGGRGGSMHLVDRAVGFKGAAAIVGNTIPVGVGIALALSLLGGDRISVVFLGEAAAEQGVFYESVNFAALRHLPVLFVCENNLYSVYSPLRVRQPAGRVIHEMVGGMGIRSLAGNGNAVEECHEILSAEVARLRSGDGPAFIEFATYRWREHCGPNFDNELGYRTEEEVEYWRKRDPIGVYEAKLRADGIIDDAGLAAINDECVSEVRNAFAYAEAAPFPNPAEAFAHIFAERSDA